MLAEARPHRLVFCFCVWKAYQRQRNAALSGWRLTPRFNSAVRTLPGKRAGFHICADTGLVVMDCEKVSTNAELLYNELLTLIAVLTVQEIEDLDDVGIALIALELVASAYTRRRSVGIWSIAARAPTIKAQNQRLPAWSRDEALLTLRR